MPAEALVCEPGDSLTYAMNFGFQPEIAGGDAVATCTVSAAALPGFSGALTVGAISVGSPFVSVVLSGGTDGNDYDVKFTATLVSGRTRVLHGILKVRAS